MKPKEPLGSHRMTRRRFTKMAAAGTAALSLSSLRAALQAAGAPEPAAVSVETMASRSDSKPNVIYLLADQWRASATGYAGDPNIKTPTLDRLAREGLNFRNAVSVCPVCTPHRAALMTGRYPTSTGMFLNDAHLPDEELCMAEIFAANGYTTGYIGKWHLDGSGRSSFIPPERRQGWEFWKAAECDHNYNKSHYYEGTSNTKRYWEGYDAFAQTKAAQEYIREQAKGAKPFVLMVSYGPPHDPYNTAPQEYNELYPPEKIQLPPNVSKGDIGAFRKALQGYYAHCTALDKCVGDILKTVDETGIAGNTILVFTSDHGDMLGSHGFSPPRKQVPYAESARVPFLLHHAELGARLVETPLTTTDILPTLLGLCGIQPPKTIEGEDLSGMLRNEEEADNRAVVYMGVAPFRGSGPEYRALKTERYSYVRRLTGPWLLFDDEKDPYQLDDLSQKPEAAAVVKELDQRLEAKLKKIGDNFRPAQEHIDEWGYNVKAGDSLQHSKDTKATPRRIGGDPQAEIY